VLVGYQEGLDHHAGDSLLAAGYLLGEGPDGLAYTGSAESPFRRILFAAA